MNRLTLKELHHQRLPMGALTAALLPGDQAIVAGCMDGVYQQSLGGDAATKRLYQHDSYVSAVAVIDDDLVVSSGYDGAARWFNRATDSEIRRVQLHQFWSWDMALAPDRMHLASVTGQYLAGDYRYQPAAESEPSLRIIRADSGELVHQLPHVPSVQAVTISPDSKLVAAGNLMGEVRVFRIDDGEMIASWTTPDFTSWGIIKSHCYLGGIFAIEFTPDGQQLLLAGMGPMKDPMAGNGKQLWQKWSWQQAEPALVDQTHDGESGEGLMETLAIHPSGEFFVMGGRLRGGQWNVALFDLASGDQIATLKTGCRVTKAMFTSDGSRLVLVGTQGQPEKRHEGKFPEFGRVDVYEIG